MRHPVPVALLLVVCLLIVAWALRPPAPSESGATSDPKTATATTTANDAMSTPEPGAEPPTPIPEPPAEVEVVEPGTPRYDELFMLKEAFESFDMGLVCELSPAIPEATGFFDVGDRTARAMPLGSEANVYLGTLFVPGWTMGKGNGGWLTLQGWEPVWVEYEKTKGDGSCLNEPIALKPSTTRVEGRVVDAQSCAETRIIGCGVQRRAGADCRYEATVGAGQCTLRAIEWRSGVAHFSDPVAITVSEGSTASADLKLPSDNLAGIGIGIGGAGEHGLKLGKPIEGGPAAAAGIERGDIITRIDGQDGAALTQYDLHELEAGPVGSSVALTILKKSGVTVELELERAYLP